MSALNPSGGEREFDALRRAQRAHEPSMEEILASIRAIIADDRAAEPAKPVAAPKSVASVGPQIVYSKDSPSSLRAVPEPETIPSKTQTDPPPVAEAPPPPWRRPPVEALTARRPEPEPEPEPQARQDPPPTQETIPDQEPPDQEPAIEPPLLSDEADRAVSESFQVLSTSLAFQSDEIEAMTREILRPMIKTWLDEHLPSLVERLVRAEIQRVARGR
jgi:cell pole-organizing protein PopZ